MDIKKTKSTLSAVGLFLISIVWGISFVFMKDTITQTSVLYVIAIRFLLAALPLSIFFFKKFLKATKRDYIRGLIVGVVLLFSYLFQSYGIKFTTASKNALLTAVYSVLVPFVAWIFFKKKPKAISVLFTVIAFVGIGLITINSFGKINKGDILTLCGGLFFAIQISLLAEYTKESDPIFLSIIQFLVVGVVLICFAPLEGSFPTYLFTTPDLLWRILFLAFVCTLICFLFQSICQKHVQVATSGVILSLEAPFGAISGVLLNHDKVTVPMIIGIVMLIIAVMGMQTYEPLIELIKKRKNITIEPAEEVIDSDNSEK